MARGEGLQHRQCPVQRLGIGLAQAAAILPERVRIGTLLQQGMEQRAVAQPVPIRHQRRQRREGCVTVDQREFGKDRPTFAHRQAALRLLKPVQRELVRHGLPAIGRAGIAHRAGGQDGVETKEIAGRPGPGDGGFVGDGTVAGLREIALQRAAASGGQQIIALLAVDGEARQHRCMRQPGLAARHRRYQPARRRMQAGGLRRCDEISQPATDARGIERVGERALAIGFDKGQQHIRALQPGQQPARRNIAQAVLGLGGAEERLARAQCTVLRPLAGQRHAGAGRGRPVGAEIVRPLALQCLHGDAGQRQQQRRSLYAGVPAEPLDRPRCRQG